MLVLKKSGILALAGAVALCAGTGVCVSVASSAVGNANSTNMPTIVIDAGHGGIDAGVVGRETGIKESNVNLAVAKQLKSCFAGAGFNCVMTRTTQAGLYGNTSKGFKMRDMKKRKEIIEECAPDMVISIHQNSCPLPSKRGATVFYDKDSESGKELAEIIQTELNAMEESVTQNTPLVGDYYMLKCTSSASVIVECGFLTNAQDERLLIDESYQRSLAYAIFKGAVSYF